MPMLPKGEKIICSKGHVCGSVAGDVQGGDPITCNVLRVMEGVITIRAANGGHACKACSEPITEQHNNVFRVHTAQGWVDKI